MNPADTPPELRSSAPPRPSFREALVYWLKLGFISFGGPAGQIAIMHKELVEKKRWISESRFLHALNYCMLLPGPEAQQLATYIGWLLHRTWGGIVAGAFFVLPSALLLWGLSYVYVAYGHVGWISAVFEGLKPAVLAIVAAAVLRIGKKALKNSIMWSLAALAFIALFFFNAPFPLIVLAGGLAGLLGGRIWPSKFNVLKGHGGKGGAESVLHDDDTTTHTRPSWGHALRVLLICGGLWWAPVLAAGWWLGWDATLAKQGLFFSKAAMVTFGGAYAVLPYVSQQAVEHHGWLAPGQMLDGLALAETTPGPLIMVLQFVGFLGGWGQPGPFSPLVGATLAAGITTWTTFLPCFLWIFLGAPYIETLRENQRLNAALSAITAVVVGVVLNLAVWFGLHTLFPSGSPVNWAGLGVAVLAFLGLARWKWDVMWVIAATALLGIVRWSFA